ncbi:DUF898 family protein [Vibrio sp. D404a]|uniref:YjgN family protein n=1 Tax=unclassified Vibrio TaxID=2614977 RepID=UPI0025542A2E|nr:MULTISPECIES: YjgN family protein [unclassified Vibrio]MDK9739410.1 DUF898 family protein [Vibrio sp. D404a]MDK9799027.1 DUF898 family protein [Vibrio sp. D449a]
METKELETKVHFSGKGKEYFGIWIVNILLSVITLGIYSAWAKVRNKRYFYGHTSIAGDNFEYHGTPIQILKGRIIAVVCVVVWSISEQVSPLLSLGLIVAFVLLLPLLSRSNARFDSAMTSFRNVHFSFHGTISGAYWAILGRGTLATLGFVAAMGVVVFAMQLNVIAGVVAILVLLPAYVYLQAWSLVGIANYFSNGYRYGERQFKADYTNAFYFKTYLIATLIWMVLMAVVVVSFVAIAGVNLVSNPESFTELMGHSDLITFMIGYYLAFIAIGLAIGAYLKVKVRNYTFSQLVLEGKDTESASEFSFASTLTVKGYVSLVVTNFLLQVVTIGLARPWVMVRTTNYLAENTFVYGDLELLIASDQDSNVKSAVSDEVAQAFDVDLGIG